MKKCEQGCRADVPAKVATKVPVCVETPGSRKIEQVEVEYDGPVPANVWRSVNGVFLRAVRAGRFYPLDPMDCYQELALVLVRRAADLPDLREASAATYLIRAGILAMRKFIDRRVVPARGEFRAVEEQRRRDEVRRLIVAAPAPAAVRRRLAPSHVRSGAGCIRRLRVPDPAAVARNELSVILARLAAAGYPRIVEAFRLYVETDGNLFAMANSMGIPSSTFYRRWCEWLLVAREVSNG